MVEGVLLVAEEDRGVAVAGQTAALVPLAGEKRPDANPNLHRRLSHVGRARGSLCGSEGHFEKLRLETNYGFNDKDTSRYSRDMLTGKVKYHSTNFIDIIISILYS